MEWGGGLMGEAFGAVFALGLIVWMVRADGGCARKAFIAEHTKEPFCMSQEIVDKEFERCWKVIEVSPEPKP